MKYIVSFGLVMMTTLVTTIAFASTQDSPIGYWKTIDDVSGKPKSIVQISESMNHSLNGTVVKLFQDPGKICTACSGTNKNQPILGMNVMDGFVQNKDNHMQWTNGEILDPKSGKIYHCHLQLMEGGQKMLVRGYIGIPLFGRSQLWERVPDNTGKAS